MKKKFQEYFFIFIMHILRRLPLKNIIVFESNPDFSDNTYEVYQRLIDLKYNEKYKFYWALNGTTTHNLPKNVYEIKRINGNFFDRLKFVAVVTRAKFIIDCNVYIHKHRTDQIRIHLKHGLPIKSVSKYTHDIGDVDILSVPSKQWIETCAKEHGVSIDVVKPLGFPRNDVLVPAEHQNISIIWMPTYRFRKAQVDSNQKFNDSLKFGLPCINTYGDLERLNSFLKKENVVLYVRFHPVQDVRDIRFEQLTNIILCDDNYLKLNNMKLYEFLCKTDALISDYSSIYYDYQMLNKPIALSIIDFNTYSKQNGLLADTAEKFKEMYPAVFIEKYDDLERFILSVKNNNEDILEPLKKAIQKYNMGSVKKSTDNVVNYLIENYNL